MKEIPLSRGLSAKVDDEDFEYLSKFKWCALVDGKLRYAQCSKRSGMRMHIAILGKKDGYEIDHIDGDGLNNQRSNLRHVTRRQNMQNMHSIKASKYPGVTFSKTIKRWKATIRVGAKNKYLGYFVDELEAYQAYCKALAEIGETPLPLTNQRKE